MRLRPRARPCSSCPYRRDCPSGIWAASEYTKLRSYDGDVPDQLAAGALGPFMCHQRAGDLCAGWVACHDMANNLAVRLGHRDMDLDAVYGYVSPVPVFGSGAEAADHGMRDLAEPGARANRKIRALIRLVGVRRDRER
jgi:hypothetical protein